MGSFPLSFIRRMISLAYTIDMFTKRNTALSKEIKQLMTTESELMKMQGESIKKKKESLQIIPATQHILESYPLLTVSEKNRLWKLVLKSATVYRSPDGTVTVSIFPKLPG